MMLLPGVHRPDHCLLLAFLKFCYCRSLQIQAGFTTWFLIDPVSLRFVDLLLFKLLLLNDSPATSTNEGGRLRRKFSTGNRQTLGLQIPSKKLYTPNLLKTQQFRPPSERNIIWSPSVKQVKTCKNQKMQKKHLEKV